MTAIMFVLASVAVCAFAGAVRYAVDQQHVWHVEHAVKVVRR